MKKTLAAIAAILCVMGCTTPIAPMRSIKISQEIVAEAATTTEVEPGLNAAAYSYPYADNNIYTTTFTQITSLKDSEGSKLTISKFTVDGAAAENSTTETCYALYSMTVKDPDKQQVGETLYYIGVATANGTQLDFDFSKVSVTVPEDIRNNLGLNGITIQGYNEATGTASVKAIAASAFSGKYIKTIDLTGIEYIGSKAFQKCTYLTEVTIPSTVKFVGDSTFDQSGLKTLTVHNEMINIPNSFCSNTNLATVKFDYPKYIRVIGTSAFANTPLAAPLFKYSDEDNASRGTFEDLLVDTSAYSGCTGITEVDMTDNIYRINSSAFSGCTSLKTVIFGTNVYGVDKQCFKGCTALDNIDFTKAKRLEALGGSVFEGCTSLKKVEDMPDTLVDWVTLSSSTGYGFGNYMFQNCTSLESVELPSSITVVPEGLCSGCKVLTNVTTTAGNLDNFISIGEKAFLNCSSLLTAEYPNVTEVGSSAFSGNSSLQKVDLPSCTKIGDSTFASCIKMESFNVGECTSVGKLALSNCSAIKEITLLSDVYGDSVFKGCSAAVVIHVKGINGTEGVNKSASGLFQDCIALTTVDGDLTNCEIVADNTFSGCTSLENISLPAVRIIETSAFANCTSLQSIHYGETNSGTIFAEDYGAKCFFNCSSLVVDITGADISTIGASAFQSSGIKSVNVTGMSGGTVVIGASAFANCPNLVTGNISAADAAKFSVGTAIFANSAALTTAYFDGPIITASMYSGCASLSDMTVSTITKTINDSAFNGCTSLKTIKVNNGGDTSETLVASSVGSAAFAGCTSLVDALIDENTSFTGTKQYSGCTSLTSVKTGVLTTSMFADCANLKDVTLSNVTIIPNTAFQNCTSLTSFDFSNIATIGTSSFANSGLKSVTFNGETIGQKAFTGCADLESIDVSATTISSSAFASDTALTSAKINAVTIGASAFSGCTVLKDLELISTSDRTLSSIGASAFLNCNSLEKAEVTGNPTMGAKSFGFSGSKVNTNFTLYGEADSTVETYATNSGVNFAVIGSVQPTTEPPTDTNITYGDANDDTEVSVADATLIMQAAANPDVYTVKNPAAADVTGNGDGVTPSDALMIQRFLSGIVDSLPQQ